ncbi:MAG: calcium-translocating P-type ATPase, PMCA-type [Planctomycetes bacterium]|nr:calcium-translocating P-type ATPase, PMCA-type [Planctomycetota bacterium]
MRTVRAVSELFPAAPLDGLTAAQVADSRARFGANRLTPLPRDPAWKKFLAKFDEPIIKILLAASLLKIVVDLFAASALAGGLALVAVLALVAGALVARRGDWLPAVSFGLAGALVATSAAVGHPSYEGLAVMLAVALATLVAFFSEHKSDREFEKLNAAKDSVRVKVRRDGAIQTVPLEDVVVGDLVALEMGDEIPADGRVVRATELHADQSLMTGESEPVGKAAAGPDDASDGPEQPGCLFRGTQVVDGSGLLLVCNVGDDTMLGQIARRLGGEPDATAAPHAIDDRVQQKLTVSKASTPLQEKLEVLARRISTIGYAAAILIFVALLVRGLWVGEVRLPAAGEDAGQVLLAGVRALLSYFVYMVIIVVVAVPEGLPMSVTVSLAIAWRKMSQANSLVRQLVACETIGSATVICSDKTGTLTQNKMTVARVGAGADVMPDGAPPPEWLARNGVLNSTANLELKNGKRVVVGNSTEGALLQWLAACGTEYAAARASSPVLYQVPFTSDRKRMTTAARVGATTVVLTKGAPEMVLALCTRYRGADGSVRDLTDAVRAETLGHLSAAAGDAMRTLAFAHAELPQDFPTDEAGIRARRDDLERDLIFDGWVGIRDPLRDDVKEAVRQCRAAGIEVKMITGDTIETARAIGREVGLLDAPDALALTHAEFAAMSDEELTEKLPRLRVLARALPGDKYRLVRLLQAQNEVVAMTGDGTNDAPALKRADVGLAMGISGTEVAKEASKIVLLDDSFGTIVRGVHWGRALYENIQRFIQFQLTINVSALALAFLGPFVGLRPPFTVLQLLWINVIMDTFAAIALCSEPPRANLMLRPPKKRDENILTPAMLGTIFLTAGFFVVVMMALLIGMQHGGWFAGGGAPSGEFAPLTVRQVTIFFSVYVFFQVWNQINCRALSPRESGLSRLFANPQFLGIASLTVVGQVLIVTFGGSVFGVEPLGAVDWLVIAGATASVLLFAEVTRRFR